MIDVCCAIIVNEQQEVLVAQRSETMRLPLKMEFPGGKVEPGELPEQALLREIREELNVDIGILEALAPHEHQYPDFSLRLIPFVCRIINGTPELREHIALHWLPAGQLYQCDWAEADIPVLTNYLNSIATRNKRKI